MNRNTLTVQADTNLINVNGTSAEMDSVPVVHYESLLNHCVFSLTLFLSWLSEILTTIVHKSISSWNFMKIIEESDLTPTISVLYAIHF